MRRMPLQGPFWIVVLSIITLSGCVEENAGHDDAGVTSPLLPTPAPTDGSDPAPTNVTDPAPVNGTEGAEPVNAFYWVHAGNEAPMAIRLAFAFPVPSECRMQVQQAGTSDGSGVNGLAVLHQEAGTSVVSFSVGGAATPYVFVEGTGSPVPWSALTDGNNHSGAARSDLKMHGEVALDLVLLNAVAWDHRAAATVMLECDQGFLRTGGFQGDEVLLFSTGRLQDGTRAGYPWTGAGAFHVIHNGTATVELTTPGKGVLVDGWSPDNQGTMAAVVRGPGYEQEIDWAPGQPNQLALDLDPGSHGIQIHKRVVAGPQMDLFAGAFWAAPHPFDIGPGLRTEPPMEWLTYD